MRAAASGCIMHYENNAYLLAQLSSATVLLQSFHSYLPPQARPSRLHTNSLPILSKKLHPSHRSIKMQCPIPEQHGAAQQL
jgi:hypothetical protein